MSIIYYNNPAVTFSEPDGEYQIRIEANRHYLVSGVETTDDYPSPSAEWTAVETTGEGEGAGVLNEGKYRRVDVPVEVSGGNLNYRVISSPESFAVILYRNYSDSDHINISKFTDHDVNHISKPNITVQGQTFVYMFDDATIQYPSEWAFPSGYNTFLGWNTQPDGSGNMMYNLISVLNDINLYAIYGIVINSPSIRYKPDGTHKYFEMRSNNDDIVGVIMYYRFEIPDCSDTDVHIYNNAPVSLPHSGSQIQPQDHIAIWCEYNGQRTNPILVSLLENLSDDWYPSLVNNI